MIEKKDIDVTSEACKPKTTVGSKSIVATQKVAQIDMYY